MEQLLDMETLKRLTSEKQQQVIHAVKQQAGIANILNSSYTKNCSCGEMAPCTCAEHCNAYLIDNVNAVYLMIRRYKGIFYLFLPLLLLLELYA